MSMSLEVWDKTVKPHLEYIEAGAEMAARHAKQLPIRPGFESRAQYQLIEARKILESALEKVKAAEAAYDAKPLETAA
ncbi:MAG: hypothetical protein J0G95_10915 [Rhizobiales bacterium]|nr:hypothetical protein [Hyphomicrobiales bacterium]